MRATSRILPAPGAARSSRSASRRGSRRIVRTLTPFLAAAQAAHADTFVIGSEMDSLVNQSTSWKTLQTAASSVFRGRLAYADNWGRWATGRPGVSGPELGMDAYPQLKLSDSATTAQIAAAWTAWLRTNPANLTSTVIQEVGIAATPGAYKDPVAWGSHERQTSAEDPDKVVRRSLRCRPYAAHVRHLLLESRCVGRPDQSVFVHEHLVHRSRRLGDQRLFRKGMAGSVTTAPPGMSQPSAADRPRRPVMDQTVEIRVPRPTSQWRRVTAEKTRRDPVAVGVAIVATALSVAACVHFYRAHQLLGYQDAYSHLEISRRFLVGRTTGIAQLGAIWLPVPHMLQAAFAWNPTLYTTGLAGAFVSMIAYVTCATLIYRIVRVFSPLHAWPALAAAAVFMTDANMLYQQTTAMDELPFYAFALLATDGLVRWADTKRATHLLRAAVACMLAMLLPVRGVVPRRHFHDRCPDHGPTHGLLLARRPGSHRPVRHVRRGHRGWRLAALQLGDHRLPGQLSVSARTRVPIRWPSGTPTSRSAAGPGHSGPMPASSSPTTESDSRRRRPWPCRPRHGRPFLRPFGAHPGADLGHPVLHRHHRDRPGAYRHSAGQPVPAESAVWPVRRAACGDIHRLPVDPVAEAVSPSRHRW